MYKYNIQLNKLNIFLQRFTDEKKYLRENQTTIHEISKYLFEKKYSKEECEVICILVNRVKKIENIRDPL